MTQARPRTAAPAADRGRLLVAVADPDPADRAAYRETIQRLGHRLLGEATSGREVVGLVHEEGPDLLVVGLAADEPEAMGAVTEACRGYPLPVILVAARYDPAVATRAARGSVLSYLIKPVGADALAAAIAIAVARFREFEAVYTEVLDLRRALAERKLIEQAKGVLMRKAGVAEDEAFRRLRQLARNTNSRAVDIARSVLTAEAALVGEPRV